MLLAWGLRTYVILRGNVCEYLGANLLLFGLRSVRARKHFGLHSVPLLILGILGETVIDVDFHVLPACEIWLILCRQRDAFTRLCVQLMLLRLLKTVDDLRGGLLQLLDLLKAAATASSEGKNLLELLMAVIVRSERALGLPLNLLVITTHLIEHLG